MTPLFHFFFDKVMTPLFHNNSQSVFPILNYNILPDTVYIAENYVLALCESGRKEELLKVLEIIDITKVSSVDYVASIFKSLGRLSLASFMEKFVSAFKACGTLMIMCL